MVVRRRGRGGVAALAVRELGRQHPDTRVQARHQEQEHHVPGAAGAAAVARQRGRRGGPACMRE